MATTALRSGEVEREVTIAPGGEEVYEVEKGVRVRKTGGVELTKPLSQAEIEARQREYHEQYEYYKQLIARAREDVIQTAKQANEQEILAREAAEMKEFSRKRQQEAGQEARQLMVEVTALVEKEKELEAKRAAAHHAAIETERRRVQAKTAEILAREEALEAEKREQYHLEMVRKLNALSLKLKLEEEQAKLKLDSLQYSMQHGEFRPSAAKKATIIVEVEPRDIPEARQFDTSPLQSEMAVSEFGIEGVSEVKISSLVTEEQRLSQKVSAASTSISTTAESTAETGVSAGGASVGGSDIKFLPELRPSSSTTSTTITERIISASEPNPQYVSSSFGQQSTLPPTLMPSSAPLPASAIPSATTPSTYVPQSTVPSSSVPSYMPQSAVPQQAQIPSSTTGGVEQLAQQQQFAQSHVAQSTAETVATEAAATGKKQKSGGFFKKFMGGKHDQH